MQQVSLGTPNGAHLQQEVEEDSSTSIEGEAPYSRHGGYSSKEKGTGLREGGEEQAGSNFTQCPTNHLRDWNLLEATFVIFCKFLQLALEK